jgi:ABC-type Na+ efflux pump permease subunit
MVMVRQLVQIARWEAAQTLRHPSFVVGMVLPVAIVALGILGSMRGSSAAPAVRSIGVVDYSGAWVKRLEERLAERVRTPEGVPALVLVPLPPQPDSLLWAEALDRVQRGGWLGVVLLQEQGTVLSLRLWASEQGLPALQLVGQVLREELRGRTALPEPEPLVIAEQRRIPPRPRQIVPFLLVALCGVLMASGIGWAARTLTEERMSRLAEFLLSVVPARTLLLGKLAGCLLVGAVQLLPIVVLLRKGMPPELPLGAVVLLLAVGYAFASLWGIVLGAWARTEAQLQGAVALSVFAAVSVLWILGWAPPVLLQVTAAVPLWSASTALWQLAQQGRVDALVWGAVGLSVGFGAALLEWLARQGWRLFLPEHP